VARQPEASEHKKPGSTGVSEHITQGVVEGVAPDHDASTANTPESDVLDQAVTGAGVSGSDSVKNNEVDDETLQERSAAPDTGDADERSGEPGSSEGDVEDGTKSDTEPAAPVAAEHPETAASTDASSDPVETEQADSGSGETTATESDSVDAQPQAAESGDPADSTDPVSAGNDTAGNDKTGNDAPRFPASVAHAMRTCRDRVAANPVARRLGWLWNKRIYFPYTLYVVVFTVMNAAAIMILQWSVYVEPTYADPDAVDQATKAANSIRGQVTNFVSQMWLTDKFNWLLNFLVIGLLYLVLVFLLNRFWTATALFSAIVVVFSVANHIKIELRNEPILPSDLSFITGGNGGEIGSFIPDDSIPLVNGAVRMLIWIAVICIALQFLDHRNYVVPFHWRRPFRNIKTIVGNCTRILALVLSAVMLFSFTWGLGDPGSWSYQWAKRMGDSPQLWDALSDSRNNGPAMNFMRLAHAKTMDKPEGYSKSAMEELAAKYAKNAKQTNQARANNLTDSTVIMILSESFSDPTRVPGIALTEDPMPNIRNIKNGTTSGLMLSPGYGGGTANIEYQSLTGLSLAQFDDSMQSPYQELVPHQKEPYTFNQIWNSRYGEDGSIAFHPFYKNMYLRDSDYKKFGFSKFRTLDSTPAIAHSDPIDNSPVSSDASTYQNILDEVNGDTDHPQFIQLVTMQNHMPYNDWYANNQFKEADVSQLSDAERYQIDTYIKGVSITDQATADFLNQLDQIDKPITVIFYGDHLPGIYQTADSDANNTLALHETDYFIWSNQASNSAGVKLDGNASNYASSNFFMAMAAEHMNAKLSPYLELLSEVHAAVPALSRLVLGAGGFSENLSSAYLDADGNPIKKKDLSAEAKTLLKEYELVQYDLTAGKGYLHDTDFMTVPQSKK